MTQKELSYVEDAIGHEDNIISICDKMISELTEEDLISFMQKELKIHKKMKCKLLNLLEEKSNG